ncbi:MAG: HAMP domain-containing histidine kinase [Schaedlerella sp.]|uniref:sensor histidine kinase n=1 Tax=Schaedlerella sp. TaxID=2676057 RepID=UPI002605A110|nr:HAMP domain-containing sensor histidine kinase [uncultured Schaedlerella sp.]
MNKFKLFMLWIVLAEILLLLSANRLYFYQNHDSGGKLYLVEAKRVIKEIEEQKLEASEIEAMRFDQYETIMEIREFAAGEACDHEYLVEEIDGKLYRIEYAEERSTRLPWYINLSLLGMMLVTNIVLLYVDTKVLKPFQDMSDLPYELAKGNLSMPVKEEKSKLFGRFLWGMDMLREMLEETKEKELAFQKERKALILSLSHDIKTPLSSIELYSKALSEDLYDTQERKDAAFRGIARNVKEIKGYVNEIVTASREDFLNLEVHMGEYYLSEVIKATESYYKEKLSVIHTEFQVDEITECLVKGDQDRMAEVLQNVMENAIKYGDGKRIRISFGEEEDCKLIQIVNSGCSLKKEELPNLFDSFYRGSNSTGRKGSGLGLYICKTLMRKMDGEIFAGMKEDLFCATIVVRKA